jgi:hypothetical protein
MGHYAKIEDGIVVQVNVVEEDYFSSNPDRYTGQWVKTSYNTHGGVHTLGGTPLRKNYAGIGSIYDEVRDAFYSPQPYASWVLNEDSCIWEAPVSHPNDEKFYIWDEETISWKEVE